MTSPHGTHNLPPVVLDSEFIAPTLIFGIIPLTLGALLVRSKLRQLRRDVRNDTASVDNPYRVASQASATNSGQYLVIAFGVMLILWGVGITIFGVITTFRLVEGF